jgi:hypothetical protein
MEHETGVLQQRIEVAAVVRHREIQREGIRGQQDEQQETD